MLQILKAKETDQRSVLYARVMKSGENMASANRKLLLRLRLYVQVSTVQLTLICSRYA